MTDSSASAASVLSLIAEDMRQVDAVIARRLGSAVPAILAMPLHEVMSKNLITVKPSESVSAAAATMASKKINCLLVVVDRQLAGIVTTYDLLDALARRVRDDH